MCLFSNTRQKVARRMEPTLKKADGHPGDVLRAARSLDLRVATEQRTEKTKGFTGPLRAPLLQVAPHTLALARRGYPSRRHAGGTPPFFYSGIPWNALPLGPVSHVLGGVEAFLEEPDGFPMGAPSS